MKMRNIVFVYRDSEKISEIVPKLGEYIENIFLTTKLDNGLQFVNFEHIDLFVIDSSYQIETNRLDALRKIEEKLIFTANQNIENVEIGKYLTYNELVEYIQHHSKDKESETFKKAPNIFRDFELFQEAITQEVRRAKRYRYPLVVVLFQLEESKYMEKIINYFSSKIREFDYLWIIDDVRFAMVLPHTGWNGAEILTSRLITQVSEKLNIDTSSIRNQILTFKRIESDSEFIDKIKDSIHKKYFEINRNIDFDIWKDELFAEFIEGKTIRIFNRYKGLLVSHDADIVLKNEKLELHNIRPLQLSIISKEMATYFYSSTLGKAVRGEVDNLDMKKSFVSMGNFEIVDIEYIKNNNNNMKLIIENGIDATLSDGDQILKASLFELSLDELTLVLPTSQLVDISKNCYIEFSLNGNLIKSPAQIREIERGKEITYIDVKIVTSPNDNMHISTYLSSQQMQIIKELKSELG